MSPCEGLEPEMRRKRERLTHRIRRLLEHGAVVCPDADAHDAGEHARRRRTAPQGPGESSNSGHFSRASVRLDGGKIRLAKLPDRVYTARG